MSETLEQTTFLEDVINGLKSKTKRISSKYFYDQKGSEIFQQIMNLEEYYLPSCEKFILENESKNIARAINSNAVHVLELGAGDGTKTSILLDQFMESGMEVGYFPMDISADILTYNQMYLAKQLPQLPVTPIAGDYHQTLKAFPLKNGPKLILFLGSNIGNFNTKEALAFLKFVRGCMQAGDYFLLAADLKKNPKQIQNAYDDSAGLTKQFNLNLLTRINRELNGTFDLNSFDHYATYNPLDGLAQSFIVSLQKQEVSIDGHLIQFEKHEIIHTEISKKYDTNELKELMQTAGFTSKDMYYDTNNWYTLALGEAL